MSQQRILFCQDLSATLKELLVALSHDKLFLVADENTAIHCLPALSATIDGADVIVIPPTDEEKGISSLCKIWEYMSRHGGTRRSLLLNVGGGMVTDLGGFAAATFKRGIRYVNLPTTLLSMVDAAVGGKTGINFCGLKNEIGAFHPAEAVIIHTQFLRTLDVPNILSGYAEMLKHALISTPEHWAELLRFSFDPIDYTALQSLVETSVKVKERIVAEDPREQGIRKALNVGHTAGHALESYCLHHKKAVLHGYAVAWGMVIELYLSHIKKGFPLETLRMFVGFVKAHYGILPVTCDMYGTLYELMTHDKKNASSSDVNFTLLSDIGQIHIDQTATYDEITEALDFFSSGI